MASNRVLLQIVHLALDLVPFKYCVLRVRFCMNALSDGSCLPGVMLTVIALHAH